MWEKRKKEGKGEIGDIVEVQRGGCTGAAMV
jgi:hypothetical protein